MNTTTLAFIGDAVFELSVRRGIAERSSTGAADKLHLAAVRYVNAAAQAKVIRGLIEKGLLSDTELDLVRKARNRKPKSVPKNADPVDYKMATAFEALIGYHYMAGRKDRAEEIAAFAIRAVDEAK